VHALRSCDPESWRVPANKSRRADGYRQSDRGCLIERSSGGEVWKKDINSLHNRWVPDENEQPLPLRKLRTFRRYQTKLWCLLALVAVIGFALAAAQYVSKRPMDFRVYYYGARGVADGSRPFYGPTSGMGWPMHYRYPPLFLILFSPIAQLPLGRGAAIWLLLKLVVLALLVPAMWQRFAPPHSRWGLIIPLLIAGPYVIEEFRYGNAQFFVFALTAVALLYAASRPKLAGAALGLAIATKVWPLFFVPYLIARRRSAVALWGLLFAAGLTMLPSIPLGFSRNLSLLREWTQQENSIQLGDEEIWFPSQSLRGVMMRYFTVIDYRRVPDANYPLVHVAAFTSRTVTIAWRIAAAIVYVTFLVFCRSRPAKDDDWLFDAVAFSMLALLEPFTQKYALVVLLWPAMVLGGLGENRRLRICGYCIAAIVLLQPLSPGAMTQRMMQALGLDFFATALLLITTAACLIKSPQPQEGFSGTA
jgi:hypothetical protein